MNRREEFNPLPLVFNHFEVIKGISTKNGLVKSLKRYYSNCPEAGKNYRSNTQIVKAGYNAFDSTPTSFVIPASLDDQEYQDFKRRFNELSKGYSIDERLPSKQCKLNMWLVKPSN